MTTYGVREFKAKVSEILRDLDDGEEVVITRHGKPCGKLTPVRRIGETPAPFGTPQASLRGALSDLPDASYDDFLDIKSAWNVSMPESAAAKGPSD